MAEYEHRVLSSGTTLDIDRHRSVTGIVGINAHWGRRLEQYELTKIISEAYQIPERDVKDPGFVCIYQQDPKKNRQEDIADELEAVVTTAEIAIEERGWDGSGLAVVLASGVPVVDDRNIPNYAREIANRLHLPEETETLNVFAACNSSVRGFALAHELPQFRGKPTLFVNAEGVTTLTKRPQRADRASFQVFSNAVAVTASIPGVETEVYHHVHKIIPDENAVLAAKMTYGHRTVPITDRKDERQYWQEDKENYTQMVIMAEPPEGKDIWMEASATFRFFGRNVGPFLLDGLKAYMEANPGKPIPPIIMHNPSRPVFDLVGNGLRREKLVALMPWLAFDGNSSAASQPKVFHRFFDYNDAEHKDVTEPGKSVIALSFGAGGSQEFAQVVFLDPHTRRAA